MVKTNEGLKVKGKLQIFSVKTGKLLYEKDNLVVNVGLAWMIDNLKNNTLHNPLSHIEVGTGTNPVSPTDTSLQTPLLRKPIDDIDTVNNVLTAEAQFEDYEAVGNWKECGMFNASSGGEMFNRINIDFVKTTEDAVKVKFTITLTT